MSELQEISEQIAKLGNDARSMGNTLWETRNKLDAQIAGIRKQLEGTSRNDYNRALQGLEKAKDQLGKSAQDLIAAWDAADRWLAKVGGGSSSSASASGGTAFSGPAQTEETGEDGGGSATAGPYKIKFPNPYAQTEVTQRSDGGVSGTGGLVQTKQETIIKNINGRFVTIFDHPFDANPKRICNQGSAYPKEEYPDGPRGTCGCCACATIINKAGGNTNEHDIVDIALKNGFCSRTGGTTADSRAKLLTHMGIDSEVTTGSSLEDLASQVEQGKGVIISVEAALFDCERYGLGGHALVLESVIRDADTGEIVEYVVVDSNGRNPRDAVIRVNPDILDIAFKYHGSQSTTTKNIIW